MHRSTRSSQITSLLGPAMVSSLIALVGCGNSPDSRDLVDTTRDELTVPGSLTVDDDGVQCPQAKWKTIADAVAAAASGDTILVCAGTYAEKVQVLKPLKIWGAQHGKDARTRTVDPSKESLLITADFEAIADNVVIDGFSVQSVYDDEGNGYGI